jgi:hypothetical protein
VRPEPVVLIHPLPRLRVVGGREPDGRGGQRPGRASEPPPAPGSAFRGPDSSELAYRGERPFADGRGFGRAREPGDQRLHRAQNLRLVMPKIAKVRSERGRDKRELLATQLDRDHVGSVAERGASCRELTVTLDSWRRRRTRGLGAQRRPRTSSCAAVSGPHLLACETPSVAGERTSTGSGWHFAQAIVVSQKGLDYTRCSSGHLQLVPPYPARASRVERGFRRAQVHASRDGAGSQTMVSGLLLSFGLMKPVKNLRMNGFAAR